MKLLSGTELAGFIKQRQVSEVRSIRASLKIVPKLAIIVTVDNPIIDVYIKLKRQYGHDIGIDVDVYRIKQAEVAAKLELLNKDDSVHGIIIQLPIEDQTKTSELVNMINSNKDVDALGAKSSFEPATPMAIMWLLAGYNLNLTGKKVLLIGKGKLVGEPLERILKASGIDAQIADRSTSDLASVALEADVIITATGSPAILYPTMIKEGAVVVDAGVASENGKTVGDVDDSIYERSDLTITPKKGGVGPLTVSALFENVIIASKELLEKRLT